MAKHIAWDASFKVGHPMIDSQHKRLFEIADELYELIMAPEEKREADTTLVLQDCAKYVNFHFAFEEKLMRDSKYEDVEGHLNQHKAFTTYVASLMSDSSRGSKVDLEKLYEFLSDWLVKHICLEDKKLATYISSTPQ